MPYIYETAGFAIKVSPGQKFFPIETDRACLMCGGIVAAELRAVHRSVCVLPRPFDVREYARRLCVELVNVKPAEDPLESSSPSNS